MFETDDLEQFALGVRVLETLDAMDGRDGLSYDQEFWEDLSEDAFEFMLWRVKYPGNMQGNNADAERTKLGRFDGDSHLAKLRALGMFKKYYRMSEERFESLYELLLDDLSRTESKANCSTEQGPIPPRACLSCTLRWLAGGSYLDLILIHLMEKTEFYDSLKATLSVSSRSTSCYSTTSRATSPRPTAAPSRVPSRHGLASLARSAGSLVGPTWT